MEESLDSPVVSADSPASDSPDLLWTTRLDPNTVRRKRMTSHAIISADSHVCEPPDLWTSRLDAKYRDRAPRVVESRGSRPALFFSCGDGIMPVAVSGMFGAGKSTEELVANLQKGFDIAPRSVWDPAARLAEQDVDGVGGEVLHASMGMFLYDLADRELREACIRAYNDFLAEYVSYDKKRLAGLALIDLEDVSAGVRELERGAKNGLIGAMIWSSAPEERPFEGAAYDAFWAAAQDLRMPITLHALTGRSGPRLKPDKILYSYVEQPHVVQLTLAHMLFGRVFERFPGLRVVSSEHDVGWAYHFLHRVDHAYEKFRHRQNLKLDLLPSEYVRRQVFFGFQFEALGMDLIERLGAGNIMWASDYPHTDSTWPRSRQYLADILAHIPEDAQRKIVNENAARLYQLG
jgi:predicted TIM-barrel fold metal-dependent hydrolase